MKTKYSTPLGIALLVVALAQSASSKPVGPVNPQAPLQRGYSAEQNFVGLANLRKRSAAHFSVVNVNGESSVALTTDVSTTTVTQEETSLATATSIPLHKLPAPQFHPVNTSTTAWHGRNVSMNSTFPNTTASILPSSSASPSPVLPFPLPPLSKQLTLTTPHAASLTPAASSSTMRRPAGPQRPLRRPGVPIPAQPLLHSTTSDSTTMLLAEPRVRPSRNRFVGAPTKGRRSRAPSGPVGYSRPTLTYGTVMASSRAPLPSHAFSRVINGTIPASASMNASFSAHPSRSAAPSGPASVAPSGSAVPSDPASVRPSRSAGPVGPASTATCGIFTGDGSAAAGWPTVDQWLSFDTLWENESANLEISCSQFGVANNSPQEIADLRTAIVTFGASSNIDPRYILASVVLESSGCVRVPTTFGSHFNPGLLQSDEGVGTCNNNGVVQVPCPRSEIEEMILDGVDGSPVCNTSGSCNSIVNDFRQQGLSGAWGYYRTARIYNSGSIELDDNLSAAAAGNPSYASDVANFLIGCAL